jgi:membrane protein implicated in regulation of membrane protease activity
VSDERTTVTAAEGQPTADPELDNWLRASGHSHALWWVPVAVIAAVALAGQVRGALGALVVIAEVVAIAAFRGGLWLRAGTPIRLTLVSVIAATAVVAVLVWRANPSRSSYAKPPGPLDLRARRSRSARKSSIFVERCWPARSSPTPT